MQSKLSHLSKDEIDLLIKQYYNGEKIRLLIDEFKIDTKTTSLHKLFPPTICETLYCPYCDNVNLVSSYKSRNDFNRKSTPFCPDCEHIHNSDCECVNCRKYISYLAKLKTDKQKMLITEKCSSMFIAPCAVRDLSFETAVYLMSLTRHLISEDLKFVFPFVKIHTKLAPSFEFLKQMHESLKKQGIISLSPQSKTESFTYNEDITAITSYSALRAQWELLSSFSKQEKKAYIKELEEVIASDNWPEHWHIESNKLWHSIALHECLEYLTYLLERRQFPIEEFGEKTITTFESLLKRFSIAQIFNLSWQSIRDTGDFLRQKMIPHSQAQSVFTGILLRKVDRALAQKWIVRDGGRDFNCAQSVVSKTLFNLFLKLGDAVLTMRVPELNERNTERPS